MALPDVTYTFANGETADGTEVNTNFSNLINAFTDGTADVTFGTITSTGAVEFRGTVTLGNSASDTITFGGGDVVGDITPTDNTYDLGSSSKRWARIFSGPGAAATPAVCLGQSNDGFYSDTTGSIDSAISGTRRVALQYSATSEGPLFIMFPDSGKLAQIRCNDSTGIMELKTGSNSAAGAGTTATLYGSSHATKPNTIEFYTNSTLRATIDSSGVDVVGSVTADSSRCLTAQAVNGTDTTGLTDNTDTDITGATLSLAANATYLITFGGTLQVTTSVAPTSVIGYYIVTDSSNNQLNPSSSETNVPIPIVVTGTYRTTFTAQFTYTTASSITIKLRGNIDVGGGTTTSRDCINNYLSALRTA